MSVSKPNNSELSSLESFLDNEASIFEGSDFFKYLEDIFDELDTVVSGLKEQIDNLEIEKQELQSRLEELE